ncbi:MAG: hypothetical protein FJY65_02770 [Calditrichaeota bacterium]|nr:hypothetical protein [Calditrichota bacterium]
MLTCNYCHKLIHEGDKRYFSRQAGMRGYYHWECFVLACKQANRIGAHEIETITVSAGFYDNYSGYDIEDN